LTSQNAIEVQIKKQVTFWASSPKAEKVDIFARVVSIHNYVASGQLSKVLGHSFPSSQPVQVARIFGSTCFPDYFRIVGSTCFPDYFQIVLNLEKQA
jgi:hypothetical protein